MTNGRRFRWVGSQIKRLGSIFGCMSPPWSGHPNVYCIWNFFSAIIKDEETLVDLARIE